MTRQPVADGAPRLLLLAAGAGRVLRWYDAAAPFGSASHTGWACVRSLRPPVDPECLHAGRSTPWP